MQQLQQFKNLSSWREDTLTVKANSVGTLDFIDTTPNQFIIQNPNDTVIYIGISKTPKENNYEFKIGANVNDVCGRPTPTKKLMVFNPSDYDIVLKVFSIHAPFDLMVLKNMNVMVETGDISIDDITIKGFADNVMLPYGTNLIGSTSIETNQYIELIDRFNTMVARLSSLSDIASYTNDSKNRGQETVTLLQSISEKDFSGSGGSNNKTLLAQFTKQQVSSASIIIDFANYTIDTDNYDYYLLIDYFNLDNVSDLDVILSYRYMGGSFTNPSEKFKDILTFGGSKIHIMDNIRLPLDSVNMKLKECSIRFRTDETENVPIYEFAYRLEQVAK